MPLRILKASAGSGKTFSLTEFYVRYCLDDKYNIDYSNILAITFTNKASAEMKDRIISLLDTLSKDPSEYGNIESFSQALNLTLQEIQHKSTILLHRVLAGFDQFSITTIDSFFTRLYGSMTLDLFSEPPRDITFDIKTALDKAADALIAEARQDEALQNVLIDLLEEKIKLGEGVSLKYSIVKLGEELFKDRYLQLKDETGFIKPLGDFHLALSQSLDLIQTAFDEYQEKLRGLLEMGGMEDQDFAYSFPKNIQGKENPLELSQLGRFEKITDPDQWFTKAKRDDMMVKVGPIMNDLLALGTEFYDYCNNVREKYATYSLIRSNYASYRILQFLDDAVQSYFEEQRITSLPDINLKLHRRITSDDTMIIYEKLGQRLHAVMIDEFQDTSQIQWNNLKPLIRNNLSEGYPNLVVGDVKQAIYRFRNGNWEIMEIEVPEFQKKFEKSGKSDIENLPINWRSTPEIVQFNNDFFGDLSGIISDRLTEFLEDLDAFLPKKTDSEDGESELHDLANAPRTIYGGDPAKVASGNRDKAGYVEVDYRSFDSKSKPDDIEAARFEWLKTVLKALHKDGFSGADIGILTRGTKELATLSEYLSTWSEEHPLFRFSSEDSLKLALSDGVQLLIAALRMHSSDNVAIRRIEFRNYYSKLHDVHWEVSLKTTVEQEILEMESELLQGDGIEQLYLFFESMIDRFGLSKKPGQYPFLLSFLEEVKKFELHHGSDVIRFLEDWTNRIQFIKIKMSDDAGKIRLFTIHKSKGLEFEIVLMPYGNWNLETTGASTILWESDQQDELLKYAGPLPINYSSSLLYSSFSKALVIEYIRNVVDHLNLLYVAMTRPRTRLYMWLDDIKRKTGSSDTDFNRPIRTTLDFFQLSLGVPDLESGVIARGKKVRNERITSGEDALNGLRIPVYPLRLKPLRLRLRPSFDGTDNESIGQGLVIHRLLEFIEYRKDIPMAITKSILTGDIREKDQEMWVEKLEEILDYGPVKPYFLEEWKVYNEKSIMVAGGGEYRPDRIQENGYEYIVIDYKTGKMDTRHHTQIRNYRAIISGMVPLPVRSFIYYPLIPEFVEVK